MKKPNRKKLIRNTLLIIVILIIIIVIGITTLTKTNTNKFKEYINNNYETDTEKDIYYTVYNENYILTKTTKLDKNLNSFVSVSINKKNEIEGKLELLGKNKYGNNGVSYLKSTYKNKKFNCEFVTNNGYSPRCDILKKQTEEFEKEIKEIYKKSKTIPIFINPK